MTNADNQDLKNGIVFLWVDGNDELDQVYRV
jgi:hypothetical protein